MHSYLPYLTRLSGTIFIALTLGACADYRYTVNEKTVYSPDPLFTDYSIEDNNLELCISQHIKDQTITAASQLKELNCSHGGIKNLAGIGAFRGLQRLKLTNNLLVDTAPLAQLTQLETLIIDDNQLRELGPVTGLPRLSLLNLEGNKQLRCSELAPNRLSPLLQVEAPAHCIAKDKNDPDR